MLNTEKNRYVKFICLNALFRGLELRKQYYKKKLFVLVKNFTRKDVDVNEHAHDDQTFHLDTN